jgi:mono/diheme cytochrome c family protein
MNKWFTSKAGVFAFLFLSVLVLQGFSRNFRNPSGDAKLTIGYRSDTVKSRPKWPASFNLGRVATTEEIAKLDIDVRPDGKGLPAGSGTVAEGEAVFLAKCIVCHSGKGTRSVASPFIGPPLITDSLSRAKTVGNYWPYASTIYDYINRAMPYNAPGSLTPKEIYGVTAYLLYANKIIPANAVMNAKTLPKVVMPNQKFFVPDDRKGGPEIK